jgi:hypothetical protein
MPPSYGLLISSKSVTSPDTSGLLREFATHPQGFGHDHQVRQRLRAHFPHEALASTSLTWSVAPTVALNLVTGLRIETASIV